MVQPRDNVATDDATVRSKSGALMLMLHDVYTISQQSHSHNDAATKTATPTCKHDSRAHASDVCRLPIMKVLVWAWLLPILPIICIGTANTQSQAGTSPVAACCNSCRLPF